jgi:hypothetical protein
VTLGYKFSPLNANRRANGYASKVIAGVGHLHRGPRHVLPRRGGAAGRRRGC